MKIELVASTKKKTKKKNKKPAAKAKTSWQDLPNLEIKLSRNRIRRTVAVGIGKVAPPPTNEATHLDIVTIDD